MTKISLQSIAINNFKGIKFLKFHSLIHFKGRHKITVAGGVYFRKLSFSVDNRLTDIRYNRFKQVNPVGFSS